MNLDWIMSPLTQYAVLGAGLIICLSLWAMAQVDVRTCQRSVDVLRQTMNAPTAGHGESTKSIQSAVYMPDPSHTVSVTNSLNLTRRTRILRMHARGEAVPSIAAALGVSHGEVELLLKLDQFLEARTR